MRRVLTILVTVTTIMTLTAGAAIAERGGNARSKQVRTEHVDAAQVDLCHYDEDADEFRRITISAKAVPGHERHGDAATGDSVPGAEGSIFGDACEITTAVVKVAEGSYFDRNLIEQFVVYEGPGSALSGTMSYRFGTHEISGSITDACLHPSAGDATVWGPATSSKYGAIFLVLTLVQEDDDTVSTRAKYMTFEGDAITRFGTQCKTAAAYANGSGSLRFW